jgi:hypothetical protein
MDVNVFLTPSRMRMPTPLPVTVKRSMVLRTPSVSSPTEQPVIVPFLSFT